MSELKYKLLNIYKVKHVMKELLSRIRCSSSYYVTLTHHC